MNNESSASVDQVLPLPRQIWPFLESEVRNRYESVPPRRSGLSADDDRQRLPYSSQELPSWQVEIINAYPLLYRFPEAGREDFSHLADGFACGEKWASVICDMSDIAEALVRAVRISIKADARIAVSSIIEVDKELRWRIHTNLPPPYLDFINDYFNLLT